MHQLERLNHQDRIATQTSLYYAVHVEMARLLI